MAHRLNPLSRENADKYVKSLLLARHFHRLETFLFQQQELSDEWQQLLLYSAGQNGNISKYKAERRPGNVLNELTFLLFKNNKLTIDEKIAALDKLPHDDEFQNQEILEAKAKLFLAKYDFVNAEKILQKAYDLNCFAFAPALGRFYANFHSFKEALKVFEKYLSVYHDPAVAMQTAEIYCLIGQTDKIAELRNKYQSDSGEIAMLCCYYFDALTALAKDDMTALKELTIPLRKNINTPLAAFMFFCADIQNGDFTELKTSYTRLLAHRKYVDLQTRADNMLSEFLKKSLGGIVKEDDILPVATILYNRKPEAFIARLILLIQKKHNNINIVILQDALKRFRKDSGIIRIGIEYYLNHDIAEADRLIAYFKETFPDRNRDVQNYEIISALNKREYDLASELFQKYFSPEILPEYWNFASLTLREKDLLFLSRDKLYAPFCNALIALKNGDKKRACDLLETADAKGNIPLLFFAARILGENGRNQAALNKYAQIPLESPYQIAVLLNRAELFAEKGDFSTALISAGQAYKISPEVPEVQLCYADKLYKAGKLTLIPDVLILASDQKYRQQFETLWVAGMQERIKQCNPNTQKAKIREFCRQLLTVDGDNTFALDALKKLDHKE
jgi:predicted Zn-dependent protease